MESKIENNWQCQGLTLSRNRCKKFKFKEYNFCQYHIPDSPYLCEGTKKDGMKCNSLKREGSDYCSDMHDPELGMTDPLIFREVDLRKNKLTIILRNQNETDFYSKEPIDIWKKPIDRYHIDHIAELNLARDVFDKLKVSHRSESDQLKANLKTTFNQDFNLALTDEGINQAKSAAIQSFATAYRHNDIHKDGLKHYLRKSSHRPTRAVVGNIAEEVQCSLIGVTDYIFEEYEKNDVNDAIIEEVENMMDKMMF